MAQEREEYKGHRIELRVRATDELRMQDVEPKGERKSKDEIQPELLIDGTPVQYGQLPDGKYFLQEYAYDWRDDLKDLARGFIDYQIKKEESWREGDEQLTGISERKEEK